MNPDFSLLLITGIAFSALVLAFMAWRFGSANTLVFIIVAGLFPAVMDFLSSFAARNYEYPGQSRLWVFTYIFFGWMAVCGTCLLIAEGILARSDEDLLKAPRLRWRAPLATAVIAVLLDLFIDPIAVAGGYWVWFVTGEVYYEIPLLNFVGWFILMWLAPLAWILIVRQQGWSGGRKVMAALGALLPLCLISILLSLFLNGIIAVAGLQ